MFIASRNIWALGWVSFFTDLATAMIKPLIPIYVVLVLNQGMDKLGYVLAVTTLVSYLFRWLGGWLSDRLQVTKPLLLAGYGLSAIMKPLFAFTASWIGVAAVSSVERLGKAIRSAPKDVLISASAKQHSQGRAFGIHKTLDIAGETVGGVAAFLLLSWLGQSPERIRLIFEMTIIPGVIGVLILVFFVKERLDTTAAKARSETVTENTEEPHGRKAFDGTLWTWFGAYFLAVFFMINDAFMVMRGSEIGIATQWLPLLMVVSALTQTLISYRVGKRLDDQGARLLFIISLWAGLFAVGLMYLQGSVAIVLAFVFQGVFMVSGLNALRARIGQTSQGKGRAYGVFYLGTAVAMAVGNLIVGQLWEKVGTFSALTFSVVGLLVVLIVVSVGKKTLPAHSG
ncbi:MFS transporter [Thiomicrorhabdus sp. ZW0627]|uniref:MFS transporter n=1 Tax=Thiomicrorhabdus sp. ZW0627 TaxID=3039774 RepID=UPI002436680C|nr:MFS transporter [Thiomicrorhabdus sp. ZW0627]MDG6773974.1 MFS transporter [Thiomicrorhabdus sp. ZW0627]